MKLAATALLVCLGLAVGNAQEGTRGEQNTGPAPATEGNPTRGSAPETDAPTWVDPTRAIKRELVTTTIPCG